MGYEKSRKKKGRTVAQPVESYDPDRYEKDEDVRAMARAHAIKKDPERHKRTIAHAKTMKEEHEKRRAESDAIVKMAEKGE